MKRITYLEALLLEHIAETNAEFYTDREPPTLFVNQRPADEDEVLPILQKFLDLGLLRVKHHQNYREFKLTEEGRNELYKYMLPKNPIEIDKV